MMMSTVTHAKTRCSLVLTTMAVTNKHRGKHDRGVQHQQANPKLTILYGITPQQQEVWTMRLHIIICH